MKPNPFAVAMFWAAFTFPAVAQAQDLVPGSGFVGVSAGGHDLGFQDGIDDGSGTGIKFNDSGPIGGVFAGYDVPVGPGMFAGVEGNFHLGTEAIKSEYGASARFGFHIPGGTKLYARGGYQWLTADYGAIVDDDRFDFSGISNTSEDFLLGLGVEVPVGGVFLRGNLDTIWLDSSRMTVGVGKRF